MVLSFLLNRAHSRSGFQADNHFHVSLMISENFIGRSRKIITNAIKNVSKLSFLICRMLSWKFFKTNCEKIMRTQNMHHYCRLLLLHSHAGCWSNTKQACFELKLLFCKEDTLVISLKIFLAIGFKRSTELLIRFWFFNGQSWKLPGMVH